MIYLNEFFHKHLLKKEKKKKQFIQKLKLTDT